MINISLDTVSTITTGLALVALYVQGFSLRKELKTLEDNVKFQDKWSDSRVVNLTEVIRELQDEKYKLRNEIAAQEYRLKEFHAYFDARIKELNKSKEPFRMEQHRATINNVDWVDIQDLFKNK